MNQKDDIRIVNASENNLKHVSVDIPKGKLVVFAGVSGSGKESDWIIDIGPGGGNEGGKVIFEGIPESLLKEENSKTGKYLIRWQIKNELISA